MNFIGRFSAKIDAKNRVFLPSSFRKTVIAAAEESLVIRKDYFETTDKYEMIGSSVTESKWLDEIKKSKNILIVMEGLTMYLSQEEMNNLIKEINNRFGDAYLIFDAYTKKGVKGSKIKNPVNQMNAQIKYGIDNYQEGYAEAEAGEGW